MVASSPPASTVDVKLTLYNDSTPDQTQRFVQRFAGERVLSRVRAVHARAMAAGPENVSVSEDPLVSIGMEANAQGRVTRNCYGVFGLSWQAAEHPEWAGQIATEVADVRARIRAAHGVPLRFLIWAGMGGSIEDKTMYQATGLLRGGPRFYALDSTDPAKLKAILDDIERRSRRPLRDALPSTLVVGMALGMTSVRAGREPRKALSTIRSLRDRRAHQFPVSHAAGIPPGSVRERARVPACPGSDGR